MKRNLRAKIVKWLASFAEERTLYINKAFLFGSIVHDHYPTSDVDLIIEFKLSLMTDWRLGTILEIKGKIANDFERTFGHKLHITFFCSNEGAQRDRFLKKAGKFELVKNSS